MKRILCLLLSVCLLAAFAPFAAAEEDGVSSILGELDGDGSITSTDARLALQLSVGKLEESKLNNPSMADVDGDQSVTSTDARLILQRAVGKITYFPLEPAPIEIPKDPARIPDTAAQQAALQRSADAIVGKCADNAVVNKTGDPTVEIIERTVLDQDEYLRYLIKVVFKAMSSSQNVDIQTVYLLIQISSAMDGSYTWIHDGDGWETPISEEDKSAFGWDTQPRDWSLDSAPDLNDAVTVSLQDIYDDPARYRNKLVRIREQLLIGSNNQNRKSYYTCMATGEGIWDYNAEQILEVVYEVAPNAAECAALEAVFDMKTGYRRISVVGYVRIYANLDAPYIQAVEVTLP